MNLGYLCFHLRVVTNPEKTQHCPYLTMYFFFQNFSSIAVLPVQAVGAVEFLGYVSVHRPNKIPPSLSL